MCLPYLFATLFMFCFSKDNMETNTHMPYEGAGFLLSYKGNIILGVRQKKPEDWAKDPVDEVEYMGGKPEAADNNDPHLTAQNELTEEVGAPILSANWADRARIVHIFQPFSKKWIWCFRLELQDQEYQRLLEAAKELDTRTWDVSFQGWTGRANPVRRALKTIVTTPVQSLTDYIRVFSQWPATENRMKDAKDFRAALQIQVMDTITSKPSAFPLRGFNAVLWEAKVNELF